MNDNTIHDQLSGKYDSSLTRNAEPGREMGVADKELRDVEMNVDDLLALLGELQDRLRNVLSPEYETSDPGVGEAETPVNSPFYIRMGRVNTKLNSSHIGIRELMRRLEV